MRPVYFLALLLFLPSINSYSQVKTDQDIDMAYQNAKKGIYWALSNIPGKKSTMDNDLIAEDKLYASVKLSKEVNGVKLSSKGYYQTNEVEITIYKSYESLRQKDIMFRAAVGEGIKSKSIIIKLCF
jgi:hypothetical protein